MGRTVSCRAAALIPAFALWAASTAGPLPAHAPIDGRAAVAVAVVPDTATALLPDGVPPSTHPVQFRVAITGSPESRAVRWDVNGIVNGNPEVGTISQTGRYTPPAVLPNPPVVTIHAVLEAEPRVSGSSRVTIDRNVHWTTTNADRTGPCDFDAMLASKGTDVDCHYQVAPDGIERDVRFHVGKPYVAGNAAVVYFHGSGGGYTPDGCSKERSGNWTGMADLKGLVVACPHGIAGGPKQGWDSWWAPFKRTVDDGRFVWAILKDLETRLGVSPKKRYITGLSAGGDVMSMLAIEDGALIAAMAPIEGSMSSWDDLNTLCAASPREGGSCAGRVLPPMPYPVSSIHIKGTINVNHYHPFCSLNRHSGTLQEDFDYCRTQIGAGAPVPNANSFCPDGRGGAEGTETYKKATNNRTGTVVQAYVLQNGLHRWYPADISPDVCPPADPAAAYNCQLKVDFPDVSLRSEAEYVWAFFATHPQR